MRSRSLVIAAFLGFILALGTSFAAQRATYEVSVTLLHSGVVFASPTLSVESGVAGSVEVSGPDGYTLSLIINDVDPDALQVQTTLDSPRGSMAPTLVVRPGEPAQVSLGELGLGIAVRRGGA